MTPKEKAKELVGKYSFLSRWVDVFPNRRRYENDESKQCALIAADEILNNPKNFMRGLSEDLHDEYWEQVKEEIKKL